MAAQKKSQDFEKSMQELEKLVTALEQGDLSLEKSLEAFEKGVKLTRECQDRLAAAEQKVQLLTEHQGDLYAEDFAGDDH
ncbi:MAG: exodeoxyribonuclease VII small subunit [Candidatus Pelagadaptatus aseana]|uniref:exodeoxyribonuclease VII small subunit n=1 Tax=Candidatus Pelagadaptatus aseana TaxID=3120508 RepID=UPI0039B21FE2